MKLSRPLPFLAALLVPASAADVTWNNAGPDDLWNTTSANWTGGSTLFTSGDNATFDSATGEIVTVDAGGVSAGTIAVGANNGSWTFGGGSITSTGALAKSGTGSLTLGNANSFGSVLVNAGAYSQTNAALRINNASALGSAPITLANTGNMTAFYFQTGFAALGSSGTFSNAVAFSTTSGIITRITQAAVAPPTSTQTVIMSGLLTGGNSGSEIRIESDAGSAHSVLRLTNASNTVSASRWHVNRGQLQVTSDGALGNVNNDIRLDLGVGGDPELTGFGFAANNVVLNSNREFIIQSRSVVNTFNNTGSQINGQITGGGNIVRRGTTSLVPANNTNSHSGGWTIATAPAAGSSLGSLHLTTASRNISNVFSGLGTGAITATSAGAILSAAAAGTVSNNIALPNTATRHDFVAANGTELTLSGVISGGGANNPTLFINTDTVGGSTGLVKLTGTNTFTGRVQINRGGLAINSDAAFGNAANTIFLDVGTNTQVGLRFDAAMSSARGVQLGGGKQVLNTNGNNVTLSGVVSGGGELHKLGGGTLTLSGTNTYTGATNITTGTLALGASGSIASPTVIVGSNTTFDVSAVSGGYTLGTGQTLAGAGSVTGNITIGGNHSPGFSPGLQSFNDDLAYASTSTVNIEIVGDSLGVRGTDYDAIDVNGGLLTIDPSATFNLIASGINYAAAAWDVDRSFTIIDLVGGSFSGGLFTLATANAGSFAPEGSWSLSGVGGDVVLNWTAVPEPASALLGGIGFLLLARRRR